MREAAKGKAGSTSAWSSDGQAPKPAQGSAQNPSQSRQAGSPPPQKKATYVNKGVAKNDRGQSCMRVAETITMPDGQQGTS